MMRKAIIIAGVLAIAAGPAFSESGFLSIDYSKMTPQKVGEGSDLVWASPKGEDVLSLYKAAMIDEPEVHFAADSKYRGMKPEDVASLAGILRNNLTAALEEGGYEIVETPGEKVLYIRTALTDLYIKKDKRGLLSYTPVGIVVHAGVDAVSETLKKIDIIEMSVEAEVADSMTGEVLGAVVLQRGHKKAHGQKETRMEVDELIALVQEYGQVFRCRLDNAKVLQEQRIDCHDTAARDARIAATAR